MSEVATDFYPFFDIQKDWDEVIGKSGEEFWISCSKKGGGVKYSHHGSLQYSDSKRGKAGSAFCIKDWKELLLTVECVPAKCSSSFSAPLKTMRLHENKLLCMDISSGGLGVCSSVKGKLWVWDVDTGDTRRVLDGHIGCVDNCRFFPSGVVVLSGGEDMRVKIWSAEDGSCPRTFIGHTQGITDTAIVERGRNFISVSRDGTARLWDCGSASSIATLVSMSCPINCCRLLSTSYMLQSGSTTCAEHESGTEGKLFVLACDDGYLRAVDVRQRGKVLELQCGLDPIYSCAAHGDNIVVCGSENGKMTIVDLRNTKHPLRAVSYGSSAVLSLAFLSEIKCICGCADGTCMVWNLNNNDSMVKLTGADIDHITTVVVSQHHTYTSCRDGCVRAYNI